jgi:hypothetical protein
MEAIILCGIQASGKTSFYKEKFFRTHMRISLDLLGTRNKEDEFLRLCYQLHQRLVVDNTNVTKAARVKYITTAKAWKYKVIGYYFKTTSLAAIARNKTRTGKELLAEKGIWGTNKKLQPPSYDEAFDELFVVEIIDNNFVVNLIPPPDESTQTVIV